MLIEVQIFHGDSRDDENMRHKDSVCACTVLNQMQRQGVTSLWIMFLFSSHDRPLNPKNLDL